MNALPEVKSTMDERIKALQTAKPLLASTTFMSATGAGVMELIRIAEYVTTGHDYFDTHPSVEISVMESCDVEPAKEPMPDV